MSSGRKIAYFVFRLTLGINICIHGLSRIAGGGSDAFAAQTAKEFANTPLPARLVHLFLVCLPAAEAIIGALIIFGLFTLWSLAAGGLLIALLVFGTSLRSDWSTVGIQMIYAIAYYLLLANYADNSFALDALILGKRTLEPVTMPSSWAGPRGRSDPPERLRSSLNRTSPEE